MVLHQTCFLFRTCMHVSVSAPLLHVLLQVCGRLAGTVICRTVPLSAVVVPTASLGKRPPMAQSAFTLQRVHFLPEPVRPRLLLVRCWPWPERRRCWLRCLDRPREPLTVCSRFVNTSLRAALNSVELGLNLCLLGSICCL